MDVHWGKAGEERPRFKDGREEIAREGESGGGRKKVRRVEGREKGTGRWSLVLEPGCRAQGSRAGVRSLMEA